MGAHHFKLYVVPHGSHPKRHAEGEYDDFFLLGFELQEAVLQRFRSLLPNANHWGKVEEFNSSLQWGSDLRIFHEEDGRVAEVVMRYAPAGDSLQVLCTFVEIVKQAGCELFVETTGEVLAPEPEAVFAALRGHRAFRFLRDPEGAIKEAANDTNQNC